MGLHPCIRQEHFDGIYNSIAAAGVVPEDQRIWNFRQAPETEIKP
ncbi:hypothetical protein [Pontibacter russatus]|nr:hypothetical protein [Pontibacter russatus]